MAKADSFEFAPSDYLASSRVAEMTLEQEGAYIRLICFCWKIGSVPADSVRLSRMVGKGCTVELIESIKYAFTVDPEDSTRLIHDRVERERIKKAPKAPAKIKTSQAFAPPSMPDVVAFIGEEGLMVDGQKFWTYYSSQGWMVGRNKMKDWKAAVRSWHSRHAETQSEVNNARGSKSANREQQNANAFRTLFEAADVTGSAEDY
jgi:hypothetical protein